MTVRKLYFEISKEGERNYFNSKAERVCLFISIRLKVSQDTEELGKREMISSGRPFSNLTTRLGTK